MNCAFSKIWVSIILIFIFAGGILAWQYFGAPEKEIKEEVDTQLTLKELKNAEYFIVEYDERIQLQNGYYFKPWQPNSATGLEVQIYNSKVAFGDLNNDGKEDAALVLTASGGGSGSFRSLVVMLNEEGKPLYLTEESLGDRVVVNSINIESGIIILNMIVHAPGDGLCCPSLEKIFKYRLSENQLLKISEDKTTNLQTYKNKEYGFEIKYPTSWEINEKKNPTWSEMAIDPFYFLLIIKDQKESNNVIRITVYNDSELHSLENWIKIVENNPVEAHFSKIEEVSVAGESAVRGTFGCCMTFRETIFLVRDNSLFEISGGNLGVSHNEHYDYEDIFNQIVSTFRFLDS